MYLDALVVKGRQHEKVEGACVTPRPHSDLRWNYSASAWGVLVSLLVLLMINHQSSRTHYHYHDKRSDNVSLTITYPLNIFLEGRTAGRRGLGLQKRSVASQMIPRLPEELNVSMSMSMPMCVNV